MPAAAVIRTILPGFSLEGGVEPNSIIFNCWSVNFMYLMDDLNREMNFKTFDIKYAATKILLSKVTF